MRAADRPLFALLVVSAIWLSGSAAGAASFIIVNNDGVGEGFNDPSPRAPVTGNNGVTLGQQRLNVFNAAAAVWGKALKSPVQVRVGAEFNPLFCDPGSAVLGSAGPENAFRDFSGRPVAAVWYVSADANSRHGSDLDPGVDDIGAQFNSQLDNGSAGCLAGNTWWYGIGAPPPAGKVDLFTTVLHEIAHGLGFLSLHDSGTGNFAGGFPDAYSRLLKDQATGKLWTAMTSPERLASQINTGNLVWTGARANSTVPGFNVGVNASQLRMFAPNPFQGGSSVSHWDTVLSPNELQEPILTSTAEDYATYRLLEDVGWLMNLIFKDSFESQDRDFWTSDAP